MSKKLFILLSLIFLAIACGKRSEEASLDASFGTEIAGIGMYSANDMTVASEICNRFKSKRMKYPFLTGADKDFSFHLTGYDCNGAMMDPETVESTIYAPSATQPMIFDSVYRGEHFKKSVETEVDGKLVDICKKVLVGEAPESNTITIGSDIKRQTKFAVVSNHYTFAVSDYYKDADGKYMLRNYEKYTISGSETDREKGLVVSRVKRERCFGESSQENDQYSQEWIP